MDPRDALDEVIARGAPAQAARARELLALLEAGDAGPTAVHVEEIALLHDAHLHDPYLTRVEPGDPR